jgi:hypothetical protein
VIAWIVAVLTVSPLVPPLSPFAAMRIPLATVVLASAVVGCRPSTGPAPAHQMDTGAFVVTLGRDTISAEEFVRTGNRITGRVVRRVPRTVSVSYTLDLLPDGRPSVLEYRSRLPDGSVIPGGSQSIAVTYRGDSAITELRRDTLVRQAASVIGAFPELDGSVLFFWLPVDAARMAGADSLAFSSFLAASPRGSGSFVVRRSRNSYDYNFFGSPMRLEIDDAGRMLAIDGSRTTFRIAARRQASADLDAILRRFAERERLAGAMTALSPRDSATARIGQASIHVNYGRPSARGRRIWGPNGVLGDTLWRTGANQETRLTTTADLMFGTQRVPAGQYTLMTLAVPERYHLILYANNREVTRIPLAAYPVDPAVEQFRIVVENAGGNAGRLRLQWDTLELSAPFTIAP